MSRDVDAVYALERMRQERERQMRLPRPLYVSAREQADEVVSAMYGLLVRLESLLGDEQVEKHILNNHAWKNLSAAVDLLSAVLGNEPSEELKAGLAGQSIVRVEYIGVVPMPEPYVPDPEDAEAESEQAE